MAPYKRLAADCVFETLIHTCVSFLTLILTDQDFQCLSSLIGIAFDLYQRLRLVHDVRA